MSHYAAQTVALQSQFGDAAATADQYPFLIPTNIEQRRCSGEFAICRSSFPPASSGMTGTNRRRSVRAAASAFATTTSCAGDRLVATGLEWQADSMRHLAT